MTCDIDAGSVLLAGPVTIGTVGELHRRLSAMGTGRDATVDLAGVSALDTAGAWALADLRARMQAAGATLHVTGASAEMAAILATVADAMPPPAATSPHPATPRLVGALDSAGRRIVEAGRTLTGLMGHLGLFLARLLRSIAHPREFRLTSLVHHCEDVGLKAVPIVALMAFLIGVVLAFQGATQLRQFGAEVFVVDLIAVSILRELGILLTAIIVAGR
ncbi:MAG: ABC transporter permease, partial [Roseicyclus sp.]